MTRRLILALLSAAVFLPLSVAQPRGGTFRRSLRIAPGFGESRFARDRFAVPRGYYLDGIPYFYADYPFQSMADPAPPQVIVVERSSPATAAAPEVKAAPLLIEWQGDRYVRYGGVPVSTGSSVKTPPDYAEEISTRTAPSAVSHARPRSANRAAFEPLDLPAAVLVHRDGHRDEAAQYAIIGRILYAHGTDWQRGYWTRQIPLSALDLLATIQANEERGIQFLLPSAPNEVITGP
jgi:hypothetical protein